MKTRIMILFALLAAVSGSCKKDTLTAPVNSAAVFLRQVTIDDQPSLEYSFNSDKLIRDEKSKFAYMSHSYNDQKLLLTTEYFVNADILSTNPQVYQAAMNSKDLFSSNKSNIGGTIKYEYDNNDHLIKTTFSQASGISQYSEFSYDSNNRINRQILYYDNGKTGYIDYSYDGDGNLSEENLYNLTSSGALELSSTTGYEYDSKSNPYKLVSGLVTPGITSNTNNITRETYTLHENEAQGGDKVLVTESSYKYNDNGYPVSKNGNVKYIYE